MVTWPRPQFWGLCALRPLLPNSSLLALLLALHHLRPCPRLQKPRPFLLLLLLLLLMARPLLK
jgi:hypothetical protein